MGKAHFYPFPDALMDYTNGALLVTGENATANIFASYPAKHLSVVNGFADQVRKPIYPVVITAASMRPLFSTPSM